MIQVSFAPEFIREYKKLIPSLQEEVYERIELFKQDQNHSFLKTHKLKGKLKGRYSFSVNYSYRIIFMYFSKDEIILLSVGDHDIYK